MKNYYHYVQAFLAAIINFFPASKLKVIGVTGTDGKTTTASLIYHIIKQSNQKVGLVTSVAVFINNKQLSSGLHVSTPAPFKLQRILRKMVDSGCEYVVLEVTSHALDQHRVAFIDFDVAVLTNISEEHLDYHKTYDNYLATKMKLLHRAKRIVVNKDDKSYGAVKSKHYLLKKSFTYGIRKDADLRAEHVSFGERGLEFDVDYSHITTSLVGVYNVYNILAAAGAVNSLEGVEKEVVAKSIKNFKAPVGRFDRVKNDLDLNIIIDFAHTPNALRNVLSLVREQIGKSTANLIAVFGCAGERDKYKRKQMGKIAARYADVVILTAEDPRTEDVNDIIDEIAQGCIESRAIELLTSGLKAVSEIKQPCFFREPDRYSAIKFAINDVASIGDWVLLLGKGHEQSMCYGSVEHPWDERGAVEQVLNDK